MSSNEPYEDDDVVLRVCECGQVGVPGLRTVCGENARVNMRSDCPTTVFRVVAWEEIPADLESPNA